MGRFRASSQSNNEANLEMISSLGSFFLTIYVFMHAAWKLLVLAYRI